MVYILCKNRSALVARIFRKPLRAVAFGNNQFDAVVKPNGCIGSNTTIATYCDQVHWSNSRFENLSYRNWTDKITNIYYDLFNPDRGFNQKKKTHLTLSTNIDKTFEQQTRTHTHKKRRTPVCDFWTFSFRVIASHAGARKSNSDAVPLPLPLPCYNVLL